MKHLLQEKNRIPNEDGSVGSTPKCDVKSHTTSGRQSAWLPKIAVESPDGRAEHIACKLVVVDKL